MSTPLSRPHAVAASPAFQPRHWLTTLLGLTAIFIAFFFAGRAQAGIDLRIEARPIGDPIEVFIEVTEANGDPVSGLSASDFTVTLDGTPLSFGPGDLSLPPSQDADSKVSVIFVMDYSNSTAGDARTAMQDAVVNFIDAMNAGDYAAIIKFNFTNPLKASVVRSFTEIDDGGTGDAALTAAATAEYLGQGTNLLDAIDLAVSHYTANAASIPLPAGPKAIIVITDGGENQSDATPEEVILSANTASVPIFTIGVGDFSTNDVLGLLDALPGETGGDRVDAPSNEEIDDAYATISQLLDNEYLLTFESDVTDCDAHTLSVSVAGQAATETEDFSRCSPEPVSTGGGGGGGSLGVTELLAGLAMLGLRRRRRG
jgi:VWFA-related protein